MFLKVAVPIVTVQCFNVAAAKLILNASTSLVCQVICLHTAAAKLITSLYFSTKIESLVCSVSVVVKLIPVSAIQAVTE
jgi:hypothetical protein